MPYDPDKHHRRSIRLPGYNYTGAGAYFVTIVTRERACLFGEVVDGVMHPNTAGQMVQRIWLDLANQFSGVALDSFVVMPNHFHGIVFIPDVGAALVVAQNRAGTSPAPTEKPPKRAGTSPAPTNQNRAGTSPAPTNTGRRWALGEIVGAFKSLTTHARIQGVEQAGWLPFPGRLWQRNYHEHIIRNEHELHEIRRYIADNPVQWSLDPENPLTGSHVGSPLRGRPRRKP